MANPIKAVKATAPPAAPPAIAAIFVEVPADADGNADDRDEEVFAVVEAATVLELVLLGAAVATVEGTVKVEPPATATVCSAAAWRSAAGQPSPLQGLLSQQPWKATVLSAQVYHRPPYGQL